MNKVLKTSLIIIIILALFSSVSYFSAPFDTESAQLVNIKKSITGSGFILRKETIVKPRTNGVFEAVAKDGVRVSLGSGVGVVISGNLSEELSKKLEDVTRRIEEIKQSGSVSDIYSSDEARIFSAMKDMTSSVRERVSEEDFISAAENTLQLSSLIKKKAEGEVTSQDRLLVLLEEEKYTLEQQLGGIREEVPAPASGFFYTSLDGLESFGNEKDIAKLKSTDINGFSKILEEYVPEKNEAAKIIDTYAWYLAASLPREEAQKLKIGSTVKISLDESPFVSATILAVNEDSTGEAGVIIKSDRNIVGMHEKRTAEFEICLEEYSGLYVPSAAIRVLDGVTGVYVMNRTNSFQFKCVSILLKENDYYIVKNNFQPPEDSPYKALKIYDNILVNPEAVRIDLSEE